MFNFLSPCVCVCVCVVRTPHSIEEICRGKEGFSEIRYGNGVRKIRQLKKTAVKRILDNCKIEEIIMEIAKVRYNNKSIV